MAGGEFFSRQVNSGSNLLSPFESLKEHFIDSDIVVVNLEGPLFRGGEQMKEATALLENPPEIINYFIDFPRTVLVLGNNHILDHGVEGFQKTIDFLNQNKIFFVGAGLNEEAANKEIIFHIENTSIAFLALTGDDEYVNSVIASGDNPGCASYQNVSSVTDKIKHLRKSVDVICVIMHWGYEYFQFPSPHQRDMAHSFIDAGAGLIIGHHPHVIQGIEVYKNTPIAYSLGNFFMSEFRHTHGRLSREDKLTREFMILHVGIDDQRKISYQATGGKRDKQYRFQKYRVREQDKFQNKINKLSSPLYSDNYDQFWKKYNKRRRIELEFINLNSAIKKTFGLRRQDVKHLSIDDFKRPFKRIWKLFR